MSICSDVWHRMAWVRVWRGERHLPLDGGGSSGGGGLRGLLEVVTVHAQADAGAAAQRRQLEVAQAQLRDVLAHARVHLALEQAVRLEAPHRHHEVCTRRCSVSEHTDPFAAPAGASAQTPATGPGLHEHPCTPQRGAARPASTLLQVSDTAPQL